MNIPRKVQEQAEKATEIQQSIVDNRSGKPSVVDDPKPSNNEPVDWEARYKGMQQSHEKAVNEFRDKEQAFEDRIAKLESLLEKDPDPPVVAAQEPTFTDKEVEEYGQSFLDMVVRVAKSINPGDSSSVAQELAELKTQFGNIAATQVKTAEDHFYDALEEAVPDWEKINELPVFKAWLAEKMPLTGKQRQVFLEDAHKRFDAETVISFFTSWKSEAGDSYTPDTVTLNNELVDNENEDHEIYFQSQIKQFYDDVAKGKWASRPDEKRKLENLIFRAQKEGRVR